MLESLYLSKFYYSLIAIVIMAGFTLLLRFLPFLIFSKRKPVVLDYLSSVLPFSIMAMLVIYCLKNINFSEKNKFLPEFIVILIIFILHKWKHNVLLSIIVGTASYMYLIQKIFI